MDFNRRFISILNFAHAAGATRIYYSSSEKRFKYSSTVRSIIMEIIVKGSILLYEMFLFFRLVQYIISPNPSLSKVFEHLYPILMYTFSTSKHLVELRESKQYVRYMNDFTAILDGEFRSGPSRQLLNKFMSLPMIVLLFGIFTAGLISSLKPTSPRFFCSLAASPDNLPGIVKFSCGTVHAGLVAYTFFTVWLHLSTIFAFCIYVNSAVSTMATQRTNTRLSCARFSKRHRAIALLVKANGNLYKHVLTSFQLFTVMIVTLNSYRGISLKVRQSLFFAGTFLMIHVWPHSYMADMNEISLEMLRKKRGRLENVPLWFRKFLPSCRPFNVQIGNFFFVDRGLIITIVSTIINSTVTLILLKS